MSNSENAINSSATTLSKYTELSDHELLNLIGIHRDRAALTELYNRYKLPLGRFLQRQIGGSQHLDESYNDVMLAVWQKATQFKGNAKVSTWIFSIAYRSQLAHVKKESRHNHSDTDDVMDSYRSQMQAEIETQNKVNESLHAALAELSDDHRAVIELSYFHGYSTAEISGIVGCPQNTVKTRLFHARKKLKESIETEQSLNAEESVAEPFRSSQKQCDDFLYQASSSPTIKSGRLH